MIGRICCPSVNQSIILSNDYVLLAEESRKLLPSIYPCYLCVGFVYDLIEIRETCKFRELLYMIEEN